MKTFRVIKNLVIFNKGYGVSPITAVWLMTPTESNPVGGVYAR